MSTHKWTRCPIRTIYCFKNNLYCTSNEIYIETANCHSLNKLDVYKLKLRLLKPDSKLTPFVTEIEDQVADLIQRLDEQNRLLNCQPERALGIMANTFGSSAARWGRQVGSRTLGRRP